MSTDDFDNGEETKINFAFRKWLMVASTVNNIIITVNGVRRAHDFSGGPLGMLHKRLTTVLYTWNENTIEWQL